MPQRKILKSILSEIEQKISELNSHLVLEENSYTISDIDGNHNVINLRECPDVQNYIYNDDPSDKDINMFNRWLSLHRNDYVVLYHGTSANIPVMTEGLRKTSMKTKKSIQSETGYVYLSLWPDSARTFGEIAYPYDDVKVYAVIVKVQDLRPDKDQLFNKRRWDDSKKIGDTLADSLVYGRGARVKRNIYPYEIRETEF